MAAEINEQKLSEILAMVEAEFRKASAKNDKFNSAHEGYAVMLEEVDELKEEVWKKRKLRNIELMRGEAKQIAAMAIRFIHDLL